MLRYSGLGRELLLQGAVRSERTVAPSVKNEIMQPLYPKNELVDERRRIKKALELQEKLWVSKTYLQCPNSRRKHLLLFRYRKVDIPSGRAGALQTGSEK
ncbi:hypothetical protein AVEN_67209-1 [Araneus ventricosus]|uniref:Uncharacterized protein n=1 Tax=Araneus ventricosus TaxID=182803 RepID=A0A4Y2TRG9_ARAVE|nr:hypothetical protein AVEN_67209-1 [Araneus ventricosus]